jgi:hypothetical protein
MKDGQASEAEKAAGRIQVAKPPQQRHGLGRAQLRHRINYSAQFTISVATALVQGGALYADDALCRVQAGANRLKAPILWAHRLYCLPCMHSFIPLSLAAAAAWEGFLGHIGVLLDPVG